MLYFHCGDHKIVLKYVVKWKWHWEIYLSSEWGFFIKDRGD